MLQHWNDEGGLLDGLAPQACIPAYLTSLVWTCTEQHQQA